jgi:hypothetical protein
MDEKTLSDFFQYLSPLTLANIWVDLQDTPDDPDAVKAQRLIEKCVQENLISREQRDFENAVRHYR